MSSAESTGRQIAVPAPAKLNLGLRVVGRRPDGLHLLESLFIPLDLEDRVLIEIDRVSSPRAARVDFVLEGSPQAVGVPRDGSNLAARAATRFLAAGGVAAHVRIRLSKNIPSGAGLGGGSSDAAAVLWGLAQLFPDALPAHRLPELALELGADVPYFLRPGPALVAGVGERIEFLPGFPQLAFVLAHPGISLATAEVYRAFDSLGAELTQPGPGPTIRALSVLPVDSEALWRGLPALLFNDLEPAARRLCPPIARLSERLREVGARATGMTGSGATVYGVFRDADGAREALAKAAFSPSVWAQVVQSLGGCPRGSSRGRVCA